MLAGIEAGERYQTLLGITGSGKTFTVANVIEAAARPTLVLAPNKTLAAQLYGELRGLFPDNAVEYFVSYYDYYQPEAYVPSSDTFIEKDSQINEAIDRLRHAATRALLERNDVIIVASVSCIYGIGSSTTYMQMLIPLEVGAEIDRSDLLARLVDLHYDRNDTDFFRGTFRARGDVIDIFPPHETDTAIRVELFGDEIDAISLIDPLRGITKETLKRAMVYPASHYVTPKAILDRAVTTISAELEVEHPKLLTEGKVLEAQRLQQRTNFDLEMIRETGRCKGIENYSRHLSGREPGEPPPTLVEYFPKEWLLIVDESHLAVPQVRGMYKGDRSRKETLVSHGFRLPSALDNRPLQFEEFSELLSRVIFVSATPGDYEVAQSKEVVEQIIRPTGLLDPLVEMRKSSTQVDDCLHEIRIRVERQERVLVTVLTKRMAQEMADYYTEVGVRARYLHSDIDTIERMEILTDLRAGKFDVLIGINLLREGLDLPEVSLVAIMDADRSGFLRNRRSLIQTIGRAARNANGTVILYGEVLTEAMAESMAETARRREVQIAYNKEQNITPTTIMREVKSPLEGILPKEEKLSAKQKRKLAAQAVANSLNIDPSTLPSVLKALRKQMKSHAGKLEFEKAAELRDRIHALEAHALGMTD